MACPTTSRGAGSARQDGALLLEQGRVTEAEAVYRADLGLDGTLPRACHHPGNVWALHGYHECLVRLGKQEQARIIGQQLGLAAAATDVPVTASCACRWGRVCRVDPRALADGSGSPRRGASGFRGLNRVRTSVRHETGPSVEDQRVLVRGHLDAARPPAPGDRHRVQHERPAGFAASSRGPRTGRRAR